MFAERLKQLRAEKNMTQIDLAAALEVSKGTVAMWETGKRRPNFETLDKLSSLFDKQVGYILGASDDSSSATLREDEIRLMGAWTVQEDMLGVFQKFATLDDYGQRAVEELVNREHLRCSEQKTLKKANGVYITVKTREVDILNDDLPD